MPTYLRTRHPVQVEACLLLLRCGLRYDDAYMRGDRVAMADAATSCADAREAIRAAVTG